MFNKNYKRYFATLCNTRYINNLRALFRYYFRNMYIQFACNLRL